MDAKDNVTCVVGKAQHNLGRPVPSGSDVLGHEALVSCSFGCPSTRSVPAGKTEITDLQFTIGIHEKISRFEIAMQHICWVDILQATESLVNERLEMSVCQRLARSNLRKIEGLSEYRTRAKVMNFTIACKSASMSSSWKHKRIRLISLDHNGERT